jgi:hypothetical protein
MDVAAAMARYLRRVRRALWSDEGVALLDAYPCGWNDGGCVILADALVLAIGGDAERLVLVDLSGPQHAVCSADGWWIDGDGIARPERVLRRFERRERLRVTEVAPVADGLLGDCPVDPALSSRVAGYLVERLPMAALRASLLSGDRQVVLSSLMGQMH